MFDPGIAHASYYTIVSKELQGIPLTEEEVLLKLQIARTLTRFYKIVEQHGFKEYTDDNNTDSTRDT